MGTWDDIPLAVAFGNGALTDVRTLIAESLARQGLRLTSLAWTSDGHALGEAWETIRRGDADVMLAGGVEAGIHEATLGGFASMKALSTRNDDPALVDATLVVATYQLKS